MKVLTVISLIVIILFHACDNGSKVASSGDVVKKCLPPKLEEQESQLNEFTDRIRLTHPILSKVTSVDPIKIDTVFRNELGTFFADFCPELMKSIAFERFAFVYWYNVKLNQYECCVPSEAEVVSASFMDAPPLVTENFSDAALYLLLGKNNIKRSDIAFNGFTQSSLYFPSSRSRLCRLSLCHAKDSIKKSY